MQLTKVATGFSFFMALTIGIAAAYIAGSLTEVAAVQAPVEFYSVGVSAPVPVKMETLLGRWTGEWDHSSAYCTIEITRVDGNNFYGTLTENDARVALKGTLHQGTRKVTIHETKVLALGVYDAWSLGEDTGSLSGGFTMSGTGYDKWGEYNWTVSRDE